MRVVALLPLILAACVETGPDLPPPADPAMNVCGANALRHLVGQNRAVLATMRFAAPTRIIGPDMAVTMDFVPERLNISYDRADIITTVSCG